ncbi:glycosyltransferase family 2 protein [Pseudomonas petrae]|uniref:Glycosyltransferase n=1 Tax=Pseudomonas petrae TaxID=2912190 RepID=A0ABS9IC12_9PSED|nr:glycosyltransferase [Pseudomonas petrae]MCF7545258.1 glycosyltransferase [Pseudomonas petrae]
MDIFHRHRQTDEGGLAAAALERALQTPEYYPEACIWKGIDALTLDPTLAFVFLNNAAHAFPLRADVQALVGRSILGQGQPALASRFLSGAWQKLPDESALRMMLWQSRSQSELPEKLRRLILAQLPDITAPAELSFVLKLLAAQKELPGYVGVVSYLADQQEIQGWAVNLHDLKTPARLLLEANGHQIEMVASSPSNLLAASGLPIAHGGVRIKVPNATPAVHVRFEQGSALQGSPVYGMPVFSPPLASATVGEKQPVDVLIPVFDGLEETLACIQSAIDARKSNRTPHRLVVIEDMTPVAALRKALKVLAGKGKITLVQNPVNLGFIRSMNRAMAISPKQDVVWLNADTRVHGNWLDRLRDVAYSDTSIASVTPLTNNGELMSFPESRFSHPMPSALEQGRLDDLARLANSPAMEIETGCGFCLYIKRAAIDEVGYLDEVGLSRGYGEETDWCMRARALGWRHMGAPAVFVAHQGGISFGEEKTLRVTQNNAILRRRYPDASARFDDFCLRDPIKPARQALQRARLDDVAAQIAQSPLRAWPESGLKQLHIGKAGAIDAPLSMTWRYQNSHTLVTLQAQVKPLSFSLDYELPAQIDQLLSDLSTLAVDELIYQNLAGAPDWLCTLPTRLDKPYRIVCRDDTLLRQASVDSWATFAVQANSIHLPWQALLPHYASAFPGARLTVESKQHIQRVHASSPSCLLIGDALHDPDVANKWLALAKRIRRDQLPIKLLIHVDSPWRKALLTSGVVHALPLLFGLTLEDCAQLAGCEGVLSLDANPGADWTAPDLADSLGIGLYAVPSALAVDAGALPVNHLPLSRAESDVT